MNSFQTIPGAAAALIFSLMAFLPGRMDAATYTLTGNDPTVPSASQSSFTAAGKWSSGAAPAAGNDYENSAYELRTPQDSTSYTFAGDSLTISGTGLLTYKGMGSTLTVNNLKVNGGSIVNKSVGVTMTLSGNLAVLSGGGVFDNQATSAITSVIASNLSGSGAVSFRYSGYSSGSNQTYYITGNNSGYSGAVTVESHTTLDIRVDAGLGTGNVTVGSNSVLKLELGATNNYLGDSALLTLGSTSLLNLAFSGTDTVGALSLDGGSTFAEAGTWGAVGSGAQYTSALITGSGLLNVLAVPETRTGSLLSFALAIGVMAASGRRTQPGKPMSASDVRC